LVTCLGESQPEIIKPSIQKQVKRLASLVASDAWQYKIKPYRQLFLFAEEQGIHITPDHYYFPIPNVHKLSESNLWNYESELPGIDLNLDTQLNFLHVVFFKFQEEFNALPREASKNLLPYEFHFWNGMFDGIDALVLYCMVRHYRPKRIIEIGSGWSTRVSGTAARLNGDTQLICIEPFPDPVLVNGFPGLNSLKISKVEEVDPALFQTLEAGDILFIDTSHVIRAGGDVNFLYLEILPRLKTGVVIHIHDIFFPKEYPREWMVDNFRFWNEQYLLQAFLAFNSHYQILFANNYMKLKYIEDFHKIFPEWINYNSAQSIWLQRLK
jgi:hypothetical protein